MDLPLITEATSDYYRNIYADPDLGPIFKGINMLVLRTHVSYFIHQLTMFDTPMTQRQLEYLKKVHLPVIKEHHVTQLHYDKMMSYLLEAMRGNGAQDDHLRLVMAKLQPLKDLFPSDDGSVSHGSVDGTMVLQDYRHHHPQQSSSAADSLTTDSLRTGDSTNSSFTALTGPATASASACPFVATQSAATGSGKGDHQQQQDTATGCTDKRNISWLRRLFSCVQRD